MAFLMMAVPASAVEWRGLARVIDGDTIVVAGARLRLISIDAPEGKQVCHRLDRSFYDCGFEATQALDRLIESNEVQCKGDKVDRYGRPLVVCRANGTILNAEMVRQGWAVAYLGREFENEENEARLAKRGLWSGSFQRPADWRAEHRP